MSKPSAPRAAKRAPVAAATTAPTQVVPALVVPTQTVPAPAARATPAVARRHIEHDMLLAALPHPIVVLADDERIIYANAAAEDFLDTSLAVMKRHTLAEILHFGSPLLALVTQVRRTGATVNEYGIDIAMTRSGVNKLVDVFGSPMPEEPGLVVLMLQQRSMAQMIERQMTHRQAARSVSGMASVLAHEIKNPLSGIRGAAQLLEPGAQRRGSPTGATDLRRDRADPQTR